MKRKYKFKEKHLKQRDSLLYQSGIVVKEINDFSAKTHSQEYSFDKLNFYLDILSDCPKDFLKKSYKNNIEKAVAILEEAIKIQEKKFK